MAFWLLWVNGITGLEEFWKQLKAVSFVAGAKLKPFLAHALSPSAFKATESIFPHLSWTESLVRQQGPRGRWKRQRWGSRDCWLIGRVCTFDVLLFILRMTISKKHLTLSK